MSHHHTHGHGQSQSQPGHQETTEALAYQLWEQAGRPEGQAARFWGEAEERIKRLGRPATASLHVDRGREEGATHEAWPGGARAHESPEDRAGDQAGAIARVADQARRPAADQRAHRQQGR